jgi:hypothetical protein
MSETKVTCSIAITLDGFAAAINQTFKKPFGDNFNQNLLLHRWMFEEPEKHKHKKNRRYFRCRCVHYG